MSYKIQYPDTALQAFVKQFWAMDGVVQQDTEHLQRIVPTGMADLIFYFNDLPENTVRPESEKSRSVVNGQQSTFYDLKITGRINLFSITFTPQGMRQFFNLPLSEIQNRNIPLQQLIGNVAIELEERLAEAQTFESMVKLSESFLFSRLAEVLRYDFNRMNHIIRLISRSRGRNSIETLSSAACLSRKQFERKFSGQIGLSPKQFLRIVRFQSALDIRAKTPDQSLTSLAYNSGYADQSHMIREFIRITGLTPGKYFSSCDPISDYYI